MQQQRTPSGWLRRCVGCRFAGYVTSTELVKNPGCGVCARAHARACVRACMHACMHALRDSRARALEATTITTRGYYHY